MPRRYSRTRNAPGVLGWAIPAVLATAWAVMWLGDRPRVNGRDHAPIDLAADPVQENLAGEAPRPFAGGGKKWLMRALADYTGMGIVVSRRSYRYERNGGLAPVDVAIAWGDLVNDGLYKQLSWSQSNRWYWWRYGADFTPGDTFVARHSANIHIIPASKNLGRAALALRSGDKVELDGQLVQIENPEEPSSSWVSSLSREDQGDGSCEVLFLERLKNGSKVYR